MTGCIFHRVSNHALVAPQRFLDKIYFLTWSLVVTMNEYEHGNISNNQTMIQHDTVEHNWDHKYDCMTYHMCDHDIPNQHCHPCSFFFFVVLEILLRQRLPCKLDFLFLYPLGSYNNYLPKFVPQRFSNIGCWNKTISIIIHRSCRGSQICKVSYPWTKCSVVMVQQKF